MKKLLRWMQEIRRFLPVKPQFILWGNIYDIYPLQLGEMQAPVTQMLRDYLRNSLKAIGPYSWFVEYQPGTGFRLLEGEADLVKKITGHEINKEKHLPITLIKAPEIIEKLQTSKEAHGVVIMDMTSRFPQVERKEVIEEFFYRLFNLSTTVTPKLIAACNDYLPVFDPVIWLVDRENDIPDWYTINNIKIRSIGIPKPDYEVRKTIIQASCKHISGFNDLPEPRRKEKINLFIDQTGGLYANEIISIVHLARFENIPFGEVGEAIKRYRVGVTENPWAKLDRQKIQNAGNILKERVKGQDLAVAKSVEIIRRAVFNLSGAQYSRSSMRPKGVLFFAGPTGVGKTELAKAVTELLFGSDSNYLRFDMSEFGHEHADQRMVGAPPGYVGYDTGGQLTNAVKQNPFSVILFDEIEKAHPKILDMFLQILDDGRLTSGRGETVFFTESLIVFTSNLGIFDVKPSGEKIQLVTPDMEYSQIQKSVLDSIEGFFKYKIGRPEILNRLGENIIVFDFIREEIAGQILENMLKNIRGKLMDTNQVHLEISEASKKNLLNLCSKDLSMGGRGIGNRIETAFLNPVASRLFELDPKPGDTVDIEVDQQGNISLSHMTASLNQT
ncbi:AAA family ATPase [Erysipelotrichia bacterium]